MTLEQAIEYAMNVLNIKYDDAKGVMDITKWG